jgi:hypothetical protein
MASAWRRAPVEVGSLAGDETHLIVLSTADRTLLRLLVAPLGLAREQADEPLLASATGGNAHSATDLLEEVADQPATDPMDHWTDDGDFWWGQGTSHHLVASLEPDRAPRLPDARGT